MYNLKRKKVFAVMMALVMTMTMMFATTTNAFASADDDITVTVRIDTRSYDLDGQMINENNRLVSSNPVVEYTVNVPEGSTALEAVQKAAADNNFAVETKDAPDYYDPTVIHKAITDIGRIGENHLTVAQLENSFIRLGTGASAYNVSGWVYGITPVNSTEFFPYDYMSDYTVSDGMKITMHYSVTGPYDLNTQNWTSDYSNPDVTMWNLYDQVKALDPDDDWGTLAYVDSEIEASASVSGNTTGLTAYYFSHTPLTDTNQMIPYLQDVIDMLS